MFLDTKPSGSIVLNFPHLQPWEVPPEASCALDLADRVAEERLRLHGDNDLLVMEQISEWMGVTRSRMHSIIEEALDHYFLNLGQIFGE